MLPRSLFAAFANADVGLDARRVFNILCATLDTKDWVCTPQTEIAEILNMKRSCVSRKKGVRSCYLILNFITNQKARPDPFLGPLSWDLLVLFNQTLMHR